MGLSFYDYSDYKPININERFKEKNKEYWGNLALNTSFLQVKIWVKR